MRLHIVAAAALGVCSCYMFAGPFEDPGSIPNGLKQPHCGAYLYELDLVAREPRQCSADALIPHPLPTKVRGRLDVFDPKAGLEYREANRTRRAEILDGDCHFMLSDFNHYPTLSYNITVTDGVVTGTAFYFRAPHPRPDACNEEFEIRGRAIPAE